MISLEIAGYRYVKFNQYRVKLQFDSVASTFSFNFYNDNSDISKRLSKPGTYQSAVIKYDDETLITGVVLSHGKSSEPSDQYIGLGGYSNPGVLEDCQIPVSLYPLQTDGKTLRQITQRLIQPFNLSLKVSPLVGNRADKAITVSTAENSETIKSYISEIAYNRNLIFSHDEMGNLLLTKADANAAVSYAFTKGFPSTQMTLDFNGQAMHSDITVMKQADDNGGNAGTASRKNPYVSVFRPMVRVLTSGDDIDINESASRALANDLSNLKLTVRLDRWQLNGKLIRPNTVISIQNEDLGINKPTRFFVESVEFIGDEKSETVVLTCVLPEVYNWQTPKNIFDA